jgi:hypothetical protein
MDEFKLGGFQQGGELDQAKPSAELITVLDKAAGPDRRCVLLSDDEITALLGRLAAAEAWVASAKLGVVVALLCRRGIEGLGTREPDGLPCAWRADLADEIMPALGISRNAADKMIDLAWTLQARLPLTAAALNAGVIDPWKAQIISEETSVLDDESAAEAEALIACKLAGKTPAEIRKMIARAAVEADPHGAAKRREEAQRRDARVESWREPSGTAAIGIFGCPPDAAAAAEQAVQDRAEAYKKSGIDGSMDQLRQRAALDALAGTDARGPEFAATTAAGGVRARINLIAPLRTLLGLADIPGTMPGWGPADPGLIRDLARRAAATGDGSEWHLTVVDDHGWAIGHGCADKKAGGNRDKSGQSWALTIPGGRELAFHVYPIPTGRECDHRYRSQGHDPSPLLRHLTQILDGTCTAPGCNRPASGCDYEHNQPYERGGWTCLCNGDDKCRQSHQVKQAKGWSARRVSPGFTEWTTPSGRRYTSQPAEYPG